MEVKVMKTIKRGTLLLRGAVVFAGFILLWPQLTAGPYINAQNQRSKHSARGERSEPEEKGSIVEQAIVTICTVRAQDPQGSIPIDEMAAHTPLPLTDSRVTAGRKRAEQLLPLAKKLVPAALSRLAATYNLEALNHDWIRARVNAVRNIKVEVESHDNASWRPDEPDAIIFGTIFLTGLRSDEAMIAVLAHELTHAVDGTDEALRSLVMRIGTKASQIGQLSIREAMAVELTCELVGLRVMREFTSRKSTIRTVSLTRALGKNCVRLDLEDETHLSPLKTMRVLLILDSDLAIAIVKAKDEGGQRMKVDRSTSRESPIRF